MRVACLNKYVDCIFDGRCVQINEKVNNQESFQIIKPDLCFDLAKTDILFLSLHKKITFLWHGYICSSVRLFDKERLIHD